MNLILIQGPQTSNGDSPETFRPLEPLDMTEIKDHLRLEGASEDFYITTLLSAARQQVEEKECWIQLLTATYEYQIDAFPAGDTAIVIPRPPLREGISIKYV